MKRSICILPLILLIFILSCKTDTGITGIQTDCNGKPRRALDCKLIYEQYTRDFEASLNTLQAAIKTNNLNLDAITGELLSHKRALCHEFNNCMIDEQDYVQEMKVLRQAQYDLRRIVRQETPVQNVSCPDGTMNCNQYNYNNNSNNNNGKNVGDNNQNRGTDNNQKSQMLMPQNLKATNDLKINKIGSILINAISPKLTASSSGSNTAELQRVENNVNTLKNIYNKSNDNATVKHEVVKKLNEIKNYYESVSPRDKAVEQRISKIKQDIFIFSKPPIN